MKALLEQSNQEAHRVHLPATAGNGPALQRLGRLSFRLVQMRIKSWRAPFRVMSIDARTPLHSEPSRYVLGQCELSPPPLNWKYGDWLGSLCQCLSEGSGTRVPQRSIKRGACQQGAVHPQQVGFKRLCEISD